MILHRPLLKHPPMNTGVQKLLAVFSAIVGWLISHIIPIMDLTGAVCVLIAVDLYSGRRAAKKRKENITSKGYSRSVFKILDYFLLIFVAHLLNEEFITNVPFTEIELPLTYFVASFIALTEFKSIVENFESIYGFGS